jgi:hypothetical protein
MSNLSVVLQVPPFIHSFGSPLVVSTSHVTYLLFSSYNFLQSTYFPPPLLFRSYCLFPYLHSFGSPPVVSTSHVTYLLFSSYNFLQSTYFPPPLLSRSYCLFPYLHSFGSPSVVSTSHVTYLLFAAYDFLQTTHFPPLLLLRPYCLLRFTSSGIRHFRLNLSFCSYHLAMDGRNVKLHHVYPIDSYIGIHG